MTQVNEFELARQIKAVREMDLSIIHKHIIKKDGLDPARAERAIKLYRVFLEMCVEHPDRRVAPAVDVDKCWHRHILMTEQYFNDCRNVFGAYLHHDPEAYLTEEWQEAWDFTRAYFLDRHGISLEADEETAVDPGLAPLCCFMPSRTPLPPLAA